MAQPDLILNGYPLLIRHKGVGAYTLRLIRGLLRWAPDLQFRVLLPRFLLPAAEDLPAHLLEAIEGRPPLRRPMVEDIYWSHRIGVVARQRYPDVLFHSPAEFWSMAQPKRTVVTLHDCIYRHFPRLQGGRLRQWWWRATERYGRSASLVLTQSMASKNDLVAHARIPADRIEVLYPWMDAEEFRRQGHATKEIVREKYGLPPRFILYFGGFNVNKNVEFLIRAYAQASQTQALPPLVLAGHINENLRLAICDVRGAIRSSGLLPEQALTPGFIAEEDVPGLLRAADLLVYPSSYEGFGFPPVEAMAVGTPVLVSDASSLPEVVRNADCRFPLGDQAALASKLAAAAHSAEVYRSPFPEEFQEEFGLSRYLQLLGLKEQSMPIAHV